MRARREVFLSALCGLLVACAAAASAPLESKDPTVQGVGLLPGAGPQAEGVIDEATISTTSTTVVDGTTTTTTLVPAITIGSLVTGNKLIMIGDSITASAAERYGDELCQALVPLGWRVEVDAEPSRFIDFGNTVLDRRLAAKWDAAYVFLGTNYGGNQQIYLKQLEKIVKRLSPMPVLLLTITEFANNRYEVNDAIMTVAAEYPNVHVLDWGAIAAADAQTILRGDGHHLTTVGREKLASTVAGVMGTAPVQPGDCLPTQFKSDRGLSVNGSDTPPEKKVGGSTTPTTVQNGTPTTKPNGTVATTTPVTQSTAPTTQAPPTTSPPTAGPTTTVKGRGRTTTTTTALPSITIPVP
jgi:hypothetical protein